MNDQNADHLEWDARLTEGLTALADRAPHDPDLTGTLRRRAGRRRRATTALMITASVGIAVSTVWVVGSLGDPHTSPETSSRGVDVAYSCPADTPVAVLPPWARAGFSEAKPKMPYVLGDDGRIVAIVFGEPLTAPESADHANKVLWVTRAGSGSLTINARLSTGATPVVVKLEAPGPSFLNLPTPGCWHLDLSWGDQTDALNIGVKAP